MEQWKSSFYVYLASHFLRSASWFPSALLSLLPSLSSALSGLLCLCLSGSLCFSPDGLRLFIWWCWWLVWRLCCLVSPLIRVDVAPARPIGAERLRLTAGHLSRAISVGAEAHPPLVGPAYREDQRQSVRSVLCTLSAAPFTSASDTHSFVPRLCLLLLCLRVCPWCASAALRLMAGIWQYVIWLFNSCFLLK